VAKKEIKRIHTRALTYDQLLDETESFSSPVVFSGIEDLVSLSEKWSNLHADPLHNVFRQLTGIKNIFLIKEKQNTFFLRETLAPNLLRIRDPYGNEENEDRSFADLDFYEFALNPGKALFIWVWMFHHIETPLAAINISMGYMLAPDLADKLTSLDYWAAKFCRAWYPKLIAKRRQTFESSLLEGNGVPFLKPGTQLVQQAAKNPDLVKDHPYYIFGKQTGPLPLSDPNVISMLLQIDGVADMALIAEKCATTTSEIGNSLRPFVTNRLIGIYPKNGNGNDCNGRHQLNEIT